MTDFTMTFSLAAFVGLVSLAFLYLIRRKARHERLAEGTMGGFGYRLSLVADNDDEEDEGFYDPQEDIPTMPARYID